MKCIDHAKFVQPAARLWVKPAYCDVRLGFEVTAYVYVR